MIRITLQYFDACPNWETTDQALAALLAEGWNATVEREKVDSYDQAVQRGFPGSPTVLLDGIDPFAEGEMQPAMACRVYQTGTGPTGSPSIDRLRQAIARAERGSSNGDRC